ncbi:hypothetical protein DFJ73DRAFT_777539 [Zopfochytrium polystomum]|nr:hypothetical protein DFJ73DRAFT_777539 [Zopfochytrium polystomum]
MRFSVASLLALLAFAAAAAGSVNANPVKCPDGDCGNPTGPCWVGHHNICD